MTHDETRDELARMDGWALEEGEHHEWGPEDRSITTYPAVWIKGDDWITHHPHPATLDGAAAALPEGWTWLRRDFEWQGFEPNAPGREPVRVPDHGRGHEMADLYALACRRAMEDKT